MSRTRLVGAGEEFGRLKNFIVSYFGDYWHGRTQADIAREAISKNRSEYIAAIRRELQTLLDDHSQGDIATFLRESGVYTQSPKEAVEWLRALLKQLSLAPR